MCKHTETEKVQIPSGEVVVDKCLANLVRALNTHDIVTASSCCGHGEHDGFIKVLENGEERLLIVCPPGHVSEARYFSEFEPMAAEFERLRAGEQ